jgi:hypothetical protein
VIELRYVEQLKTNSRGSIVALFYSLRLEFSKVEYFRELYTFGFEYQTASSQLFLPKKSNNQLVLDSKEIESRVQKLLIDLTERRHDDSDESGLSQEKRSTVDLDIGDRVLIKKTKKGQETIGTVISMGRKFVTVNTATQSIKRIPQNLKKVGK